MSRILTLLVAVLFASSVWAQSPLSTTGVGVGHVAAGGGFSPSCSQSSAFLARTSGLDLTHENAYDALICGLVTDGVWAKFDALWITGAPDSTTALLNLVSSSFGLSLVNTPTFSANNGYTGVVGTTSYIDSNFNPATNGSTYTQNSAHYSFYDCTSRGTETSIQMGAANLAATSSDVLETQLSGNAQLDINVATSGAVTFANADAKGFFVANRTGATASALYKNATSLGTSANSSTAPVSFDMYILAFNNAGSIAFITGDQAFEASVGAGLTGTDITNFNSRLATFRAAVGSSC